MAAKKAAKAPKKAAKPAKAKKATQKRPPGRPTDYSPELANRICEQIAQGRSVRSIVAEDKGMPALSSIYLWLSKHPEFSDQYARAKADSAEAMAEEMLEIADRTDRDFTLDPETMTLRVDGEHIQRARLMVDTRKWLLSKLAPKKYGDKVDVNHGGQPDNPLTMLLQQVEGTALKPRATTNPPSQE